MSEIKRVTSPPPVLGPDDLLLLKENNTASFLVVDKTGTKAYAVDEKIALTGPSELYHNQEGLWEIKSYTDRALYSVASTTGTVWINDGYVHFKVTNTALTTASFTVNGREFVIAMLPVQVVAPSISAPLQGATNIPVSGARVIAGDFSLNTTVSGEYHYSTDWEVSTDINFATIVASSYNDKINLTAWTIPN